MTVSGFLSPSPQALAQGSQDEDRKVPRKSFSQDPVGTAWLPEPLSPRPPLARPHPHGCLSSWLPADDSGEENFQGPQRHMQHSRPCVLLVWKLDKALGIGWYSTQPPFLEPSTLLSETHDSQKHTWLLSFAGEACLPPPTPGPVKTAGLHRGCNRTSSG